MKLPFIAPEEFRRGDLVVRAYRESDAMAMRDAVNASYEHLKPWMPWATENQTQEDTRQLIRKFIANRLLNVDFTMGIFWGDEYAGGTGFHLRGASVESGSGEVGMWIRQECAGVGLGTRVLEAMLEWGFRDWGWDRIFWRCDTRNLPSARVAEKCGLRHEGTFRSDSVDVAGHRRDTHVYAMIREDWR
jgi:RimJ/RimL family protein N-acetyltransferase